MLGAAIVALLPSSAVSQSPTPVNPNRPPDDNSYYAIRLLCPKHSSDAMYYWIANKAAWTTRLTIEFSSGSISAVKMEVGQRPTGAFETVTDSRVDATMTDKVRFRVEQVTIMAKRLYHDVCLAGKSAHSQHEALLFANRKFLGVELPD